MEHSTVRRLTDSRLEVIRSNGRPAASISSPSNAPKPRLLDQVRQAVRALHYGDRTEEAYVDWVRRFVLFHNKRHPAEMTEPEVNQFLAHVAHSEHVSASDHAQATAAVRFLYSRVLNKPLAGLADAAARPPIAGPTQPAGQRQPKLLDRVRQTIRTLHYSPRTEQAYVYWITRSEEHTSEL